MQRDWVRRGGGCQWGITVDCGVAESSGGACVAPIVLQVKSGLKVLVDGSDVSHDTLPVRPLRVHHLIYVLEQRKTEFRSLTQVSSSRSCTAALSLNWLQFWIDLCVTYSQPMLDYFWLNAMTSWSPVITVRKSLVFVLEAELVLLFPPLPVLMLHYANQQLAVDWRMSVVQKQIHYKWGGAYQSCFPSYLLKTRS